MRNGALHGFFIASVICEPKRKDGELRRRWISLLSRVSRVSSSKMLIPPLCSFSSSRFTIIVMLARI